MLFYSSFGVSKRRNEWRGVEFICLARQNGSQMNFNASASKISSRFRFLWAPKENLYAAKTFDWQSIENYCAIKWTRLFGSKTLPFFVRTTIVIQSFTISLGSGTKEFSTYMYQSYHLLLTRFRIKSHPQLILTSMSVKMTNTTFGKCECIIFIQTDTRTHS